MIPTSEFFAILLTEYFQRAKLTYLSHQNPICHLLQILIFQRAKLAYLSH